MGGVHPLGLLGLLKAHRFEGSGHLYTELPQTFPICECAVSPSVFK